MNTLLIDAHPRSNSLCAALAEAYYKGAIDAKATIEFVRLRDLKFDPILDKIYRENVLEKDLKMMQEKILWCNHLVIVTPVWWMSMPALLKGFFDRILTPGYAYQYTKGSLLPLPKRFLKGRSCRVIYTQGGPRYLTNTIGFDAFWKALKYGTLVFCGFGPVRRSTMPYVSRSSEEKRNKYLKRAYNLGKKLK